MIEWQARIEWSVPADASRIIETFGIVDGGTHVRIQQVGLVPDWPSDSHSGRVRGWQESIADLVLILDYGVRATRHMAARADVGMRTVEVSAGLCVEGVAADGPAERAGLRQGDLLLSIERMPVYRQADFSIILRGHSAGETVQVRFVRCREMRTAAVTLR